MRTDHSAGALAWTPGLGRPAEPCCTLALADAPTAHGLSTPAFLHLPPRLVPLAQPANEDFRGQNGTPGTPYSQSHGLVLDRG